MLGAARLAAAPPHFGHDAGYRGIRRGGNASGGLIAADPRPGPPQLKRPPPVKRPSPTARSKAHLPELRLAPGWRTWEHQVQLEHILTCPKAAGDRQWPILCAGECNGFTTSSSSRIIRRAFACAENRPLPETDLNWESRMPKSCTRLRQRIGHCLGSFRHSPGMPGSVAHSPAQRIGHCHGSSPCAARRHATRTPSCKPSSAVALASGRRWRRAPGKRNSPATRPRLVLPGVSM